MAMLGECSHIEFCVVGTPVTQGSKVLYGRNLVESTNRKTKTFPANRLKDWRLSIYDAAMTAKLTGPPGPRFWLGPVSVSCKFTIQRPDSHFKKDGGIRKGKPEVPPGDLDKYLRAVGDALSGIVYKDDNQIVSFDGSSKRWGLVSGVEVVVDHYQVRGDKSGVLIEIEDMI